MTIEDPKLSKSFMTKGFEATGASIYNWSKNTISTHIPLEASKEAVAKGIGAAHSLLRVTKDACHVPESTKVFLLKGFELTDGFFKAGKAFSVTQGSLLKTKITNNGKVIVGYKSEKSAIFRFDKAHRGAEFNHVNINPKFSGLKKDPHLPLPPGGLAVSSFFSNI